MHRNHAGLHFGGFPQTASVRNDHAGSGQGVRAERRELLCQPVLPRRPVRQIVRDDGRRVLRRPPSPAAPGHFAQRGSGRGPVLLERGPGRCLGVFPRSADRHPLEASGREEVFGLGAFKQSELTTLCCALER